MPYALNSNVEYGILVFQRKDDPHYYISEHKSSHSYHYVDMLIENLPNDATIIASLHTHVRKTLNGEPIFTDVEAYNPYINIVIDGNGAVFRLEPNTADYSTDWKLIRPGIKGDYSSKSETSNMLNIFISQGIFRSRHMPALPIIRR